MSKHRSYGKKASGGKKRNVLKRFERVKVLKERGHWGDRATVFNLPKTKTVI